MQQHTLQTVSEIAAASLAAVRVFEKYGIDYCCGGKRPLAEVCRAKGQDPVIVQAELDAALAAAPESAQDWNTAPLADLIGHIVSTHHEYLRRELPSIQVRLDKVYRVYNQRYGPTLIGLPEVYCALRDELELHLRKEEMILFPAIIGKETYPMPPGAIACPIRVMESEHESALNALARIREITGNFAIPDYACTTYRALMAGLEELDRDLREHIHLENDILHPRAQA